MEYQLVDDLRPEAHSLVERVLGAVAVGAGVGHFHVGLLQVGRRLFVDDMDLPYAAKPSSFRSTRV